MISSKFITSHAQLTNWSPNSNTNQWEIGRPPGCQVILLQTGHKWTNNKDQIQNQQQGNIIANYSESWTLPSSPPGGCNRGGFDRPFSWLEYCVILLAVRIIIIPPSGVGRTSWFCLPRGNHHHHHPFHQYISHYPLILQKKKTVFISHYRKCSMSHLAPLMQLTFSISPINAEKYGN